MSQRIDAQAVDLLLRQFRDMLLSGTVDEFYLVTVQKRDDGLVAVNCHDSGTTTYGKLAAETLDSYQRRKQGAVHSLFTPRGH